MTLLPQFYNLINDPTKYTLIINKRAVEFDPDLIQGQSSPDSISPRFIFDFYSFKYSIPINCVLFCDTKRIECTINVIPENTTNSFYLQVKKILMLDTDFILYQIDTQSYMLPYVDLPAYIFYLEKNNFRIDLISSQQYIQFINIKYHMDVHKTINNEYDIRNKISLSELLNLYYENKVSAAQADFLLIYCTILPTNIPCEIVCHSLFRVRSLASCSEVPMNYIIQNGIYFNTKSNMNISAYSLTIIKSYSPGFLPNQLLITLFNKLLQNCAVDDLLIQEAFILIEKCLHYDEQYALIQLLIKHDFNRFINYIKQAKPKHIVYTFPISKYTLSGIKNPSHFCYIIALCEMLSTLPTFLKVFVESETNNTILYSLRQLLVNIHIKSYRSNVKIFSDIFIQQYPKFNKQSDLKEFFDILIQIFAENGLSDITSLFKMEIKTEINRNGIITNNIESFNYITLSSNNATDSIDKMLKSQFETELIIDEQGSSITRKAEIVTFPLYFLIAFPTNPKTDIYVPCTINIFNRKYELHSIVQYTGSGSSGHYTVLTKMDNCWYFINDNKAYFHNNSMLNAYNPFGRKPYLLCYTSDNSSMPFQLLDQSTSATINYSFVPQVVQSDLWLHCINRCVSEKQYSKNFVQFIFYILFHFYGKSYSISKIILDNLRNISDKSFLNKEFCKFFDKFHLYVIKYFDLINDESITMFFFRMLNTDYPTLLCLISAYEETSCNIPRCIQQYFVNYIISNKINNILLIDRIKSLLPKSNHSKMLSQYIVESNLLFPHITDEADSNSIINTEENCNISKEKAQASDQEDTDNIQTTNIIKMFISDIFMDTNLHIEYDISPNEDLIAVFRDLIKQTDLKNMFKFSALIHYATNSNIRIKSEKIEDYYIDISNSYFINEYGYISKQTQELYLDCISYDISYIYQNIYINDSNNLILLINNNNRVSYKLHLGSYDYLLKGCFGVQNKEGKKEYSYIINYKGIVNQFYDGNKYKINDPADFMETYNVQIWIYEKQTETHTSQIKYHEAPILPKQITVNTIFYSVLKGRFPNIIYQNKQKIQTLLRNDFNKNKYILAITKYQKILSFNEQYNLALGVFNDTDFPINDRKILKELSQSKFFLRDFKLTDLEPLIQSFMEKIELFQLNSNINNNDSLQEQLKNDVNKDYKIPVGIFNSIINSNGQLNDLQTLCLSTYINSSISTTRNGTRYIIVLKNKWIELFIIDQQSCICIAQIWNGPSSATLYRWYKEYKETHGYPHKYMQGNSIKTQLESWGKKCKYKNEPAILAIDAMALQKHIRITNEGEVIGTIEPMTISTNNVKAYKSDPFMFNEFLKGLEKNHKLIKAVFVIILVTLNDNICTPIHIKFSNSGSANQETETLLKHFCTELEESPYFKLYGISFDGDRRYMNFHIEFINYWIYIFLESYNLSQCLLKINRTKIIIGDPPHLLKRSRYYIINHENFIIGENSKKIIYKNEIQYILRDEIIPSYIWNKAKNTKMDDNYPRVLFTPQALLTLITNNNWIAFAMFLPSVLLSSYYYINMTRDEIGEILSIGFFFTYLLLLEENGRPITYVKQKNINSKNKTTSSKKIVSFDDTDDDEIESEVVLTNHKKYFQIIDIQWGREYLNTVISILYCINNITKSFSVDRLGTMIDEHFFSKTRRSSGYDKTYEHFLDVFDKIIYATEINKELKGQRSHARYPPAIVPENKERRRISGKIIARSKKIAEYLFCMVTSKQQIKHVGFNEINGENFSLNTNSEYMIHFKNILLKLQKYLDEKNLKHDLSSSESVFRPDRTANIYPTIYA